MKYLPFIVILFLSGSLVFAEIYRFKDENGVWHFSNINNDRRYTLYAPPSFGYSSATYIREYKEILEKASGKYNIDISLIKAVIKAESDFDSQAVSSVGAQGLMQLMPETSEDLEVEDPFDAEENILGGTQYLGILLKRYNNDKKLALAAYNAGPTNVDYYDGIPPFEETQTFVKRVLKYYEEYKSGNK